MRRSKRKKIKIHTFSPLPPLSVDEFNRLDRFAEENSTVVGGVGVLENGPHIPLVVVFHGNWRLIKQELKRMGRDFNESVPYWINWDEAGPAECVI